MLVLSRKVGERIIINNDITIILVDIRGEKARIGIEAHPDIPVHRAEVQRAIEEHGPKRQGPAMPKSSALPKLPVLPTVPQPSSLSPLSPMPSSGAA